MRVTHGLRHGGALDWRRKLAADAAVGFLFWGAVVHMVWAFFSGA
jgi:hypothetical protein